MNILKDKIMSSSRNAREARLRQRLASRLFGDSAAVYLEFAMSFPLLLGFSLFIVEMCMFWDSAIMANHTAFTLARIAKVHYYQGYGGASEDDPYPEISLGSSKFGADKIVASFLMMGSTIGWMDGGKPSVNVNFEDYFKIDKPLFEISASGDANFFQKLVVKILNSLLNPVEQKMRDFINNEIQVILDKIFDQSSASLFNTRFNMALQRCQKPGVIVTERLALPGSLKFPSDDYDTNACSSPEIVKVSINYPIHKGGWLYTVFMFWKADNDRDSDSFVATGRSAMLIEPERDVEDYKANDDGTANLDPDDMRKKGEARARKIIADTSIIIDDWEAAVKHRVDLENKYGGRHKASKHQDYNDACSNESNLWGKIKTNCIKYMQLLETDPRKGIGLCGDKDDGAGLFCKTTDFTKCARSENAKLLYCDKVSNRIAKIANNYDLFQSFWHSGFPHYVDKDIAYPNHSHGLCGKQYFCESP
jgi:hypothetical protein